MKGKQVKPKDITRREVANMTDDQLAKAHSEMHGIDRNIPKDFKQRQKEAWEAHDILAAEMNIRQLGHKSPLGTEDEGHTPASSKPSTVEHADGAEVDQADSKHKNAGLGGDMSNKADSYDCECLECGHTMTTTEHCADIACPECGAEMRREDRPGAGKDARKRTGKGVRIKMGKVYFLLSEMNKALQDAFGDYAYYAEIDVDGPAVIADVWNDKDDSYVTYRIPFELTTVGIVLDLDNKVEVEPQTIYTAKEADVVITAPVVKESMDDEKRYALYVAYVPEVDDSQGERMTKEDIEKACWSFGKKCYFAQGNRIDMQHTEDVEKHGECMVVENFVSRSDGYMGQPEGTWFVGIIHGEDEWAMLKNGEINGVSMAGQAAKEEREVEDNE